MNKEEKYALLRKLYEEWCSLCDAYNAFLESRMYNQNMRYKICDEKDSYLIVLYYSNKGILHINNTIYTIPYNWAMMFFNHWDCYHQKLSDKHNKPVDLISYDELHVNLL